MFKFKTIKKGIFTPRAMKGDIIRCNLEDGPSTEFYVGKILSSGVIEGYFIDSLFIQNWLFGENYNIMCNAMRG
jgi:hypothetical protein